MHAVLGLSSLLLTFVASQVVLRNLRYRTGWSSRRKMQFLVLWIPFFSLLLALAGFYHFSGLPCFFTAPSWDTVVSSALPVGMALFVLGSVSLGIVRLMLMVWWMAHRKGETDPALQMLVNRLANRLHVRPPAVKLCDYPEPLALVYGFSTPSLLLSTWMITHLDAQELEAVIAHEVGHILREDYRLTWLATILRDAFFYLPTSQSAYRQLQAEKELACDDQAVRLTSRPLALASALVKVWQYAIHQPRIGIAQSLVGQWLPIEQRVERLLSIKPVGEQPSKAGLGLLRFELVALLSLLAVEAALVIGILLLMGCAPEVLMTVIKAR